MTSREKLLQLRRDFYTNNSLNYDSISYFTSIEKDLEDLEKYEKALEIIARKLNPSVIKQNSYYYLVIPHPSPYHDSTYRFLLEEEGQILFELFGGTNYDTE